MKHKGTLALISYGSAAIITGAVLNNSELIGAGLPALFYSPYEFCLEKVKYGMQTSQERLVKAREEYSASLKKILNVKSKL